MLRVFITAVLCATALIGNIFPPARAGSYPNGPITLVNPYAAGGPADVLARTIIDPLKEILGQPVVLLNKPGGATAIAAAYVAAAPPDGQTLLYVDRHLIHDGYAPAFEFMRQRGLRPRTPARIFGTPDHYVPTDSRELTQITDLERRHMVSSLVENAAADGITLFGLKDPRQGIVHVIGPEQGISQPGMIIVCGDSHTSTHGALGALAFGIGMTEVTHVLATQTLWQRKPKTMRITVH